MPTNFDIKKLLKLYSSQTFSIPKDENDDEATSLTRSVLIEKTGNETTCWTFINEDIHVLTDQISFKTFNINLALDSIEEEIVENNNEALGERDGWIKITEE